METFISIQKLFQLDLPDGWSHEFEDSLYTFQNDETAALQISAMFHSGRKDFVLQEELKKKQKEHPAACITELSEYGAIHYGIEMIDEKMLQYHWITGHKMLCCLLL